MMEDIENLKKSIKNSFHKTNEASKRFDEKTEYIKKYRRVKMTKEEYTEKRSRLQAIVTTSYLILLIFVAIKCKIDSAIIVVGLLLIILGFLIVIGLSNALSKYKYEEYYVKKR